MTADAAAALDVAGQLQALAADIHRRGFATDIRQAGAQRGVHVVNRLAAELSETVYAAPSANGDWWFWWSWGERIAPISEVATTAFKVAYMLTPGP